TASRANCSKWMPTIRTGSASHQARHAASVDVRGGMLAGGLALPRLKHGGCSVHPRGHCHESPKGLPGPLNVSCGVFISVEHEATGWANMGTHAESLGRRVPHPEQSCVVSAGGTARGPFIPWLKPRRFLPLYCKVILPADVGAELDLGRDIPN